MNLNSSHINNDEILSYFHLNKLDTRLGNEINRCLDIDDKTIVNIKFNIKPFYDLYIKHNVEILIKVSTNYHVNGNLKVYILDDDNRSECIHIKDKIDEIGKLTITSNIEKVKYPFTVWFYVIRQYFKFKSKVNWISAILLNNEFQSIYTKWPNIMLQNGANDKLLIYNGVGKTRGKRNYMEDTDILFENMRVNDTTTATNTKQQHHMVSIYGVLDGHGGKECAQFCAEDIPMKIIANLRNNLSCAESLYKAFLDSDQEYLDSDVHTNAGTTANISVYDNYQNTFYFANTGDTRAVLSRSGGKAMDLSYDRKGSDPEEIARIIEAGGNVTQGRVMGSLAVTRALGDLQLKEQGPYKLQRVLIPDPEISVLYPTIQDEFIIIATDGLWDVMTSQAAVDYVRALLVQENLLGNNAGEYADLSTLGNDIISLRLSQIANKMAVHAVNSLNSMDNVTVFILVLQGGPNKLPININPIYTMYEENNNNSTISNNNNIVKNHNFNDMANDYLSRKTKSTSPDKQKRISSSDNNSYIDISSLSHSNNNLNNLSIQNIKYNQLHIDHTNNIQSTQNSTNVAQPPKTYNTIVFQKQSNNSCTTTDNSNFNHSFLINNDSSNNNQITSTYNKSSSSNNSNTNSNLLGKPYIAGNNTIKNTITTVKDDDDNDLMDFLNDDSNF